MEMDVDVLGRSFQSVSTCWHLGCQFEIWCWQVGSAVGLSLGFPLISIFVDLLN